MNMGEPETLTTFLQFGRERFDTDSYALVLWDHGGGPLHGVCWDEIYHADSLSLGEITTALANARIGEQDKLRFIGFDACLMGSIEVAAAMEPYADYMIASEETEPGAGWNYSFLNQIEESIGDTSLGERIVDGYFEAQEGAASVLTMACYDLSKVREVSAAAESFFAGIGVLNASNFVMHAEARREALGYGRAYGADGDYDMVDLSGMLQADAYTDAKGADALRTALEAMVIYHRSNTEGSGGISIFYPYYESRNFLKDGYSSYAAYTVSPAYLRYLASFVRVQNGNTLTNWAGLTIESDESQDHFTLQVTPEQAGDIVSAELLVLRELIENDGPGYSLVSRTQAGMPDKDGILHAQNPRHMLTNADGFELIPYSVTDTGRYRLHILTHGDYSTNGYLELMDGEDDAVEIADYYLYDAETQHLTNRHSFDVTKQDEWVFGIPTYFTAIDESGAIRGFDRWTRSRSIWTRTSQNADCMRFSFKDTGDVSDRLYAVWQLTDAQGNTWCSNMVQLSGTHTKTSGLLSEQTDGPLQLTGGWVTCHQDVGVTVVMELTNTSDHTLLVKQMDYCTAINGLCIDSNVLGGSAITLEPGQTATKAAAIYPKTLYGLSEISDVAVYV